MHLSVDGMDCCIPQQKDGKTFVSHKSTKVWWQVWSGSCNPDRINWLINGHFHCGFWMDITIYHHSLHKWLPPGDRCEADDGNDRESPHSIIPLCCDLWCSSLGVGKDDGYLSWDYQWAPQKKFHFSQNLFYHDLAQHGYAFRACTSLIQLSIEHGDPLFPVNYNPNVGI